jgi:excisionase family DNA binding protein
MTPETHAPTQPDFFTVESVAEQLGLSLATIRRAIRDGRLATYRFGRAVRIGRTDLETFLANARK